MAIDPSIASLAALFQPQGDQPDQSMMADALRQREQLGMLAQLSGNQTAQPFAQTVLKGVADDRDAQTAAQQQAAQRQMALVQLGAKQKEQAADNDRQERTLSESIRFHKDLAANPAMAQVWGMGAAQPGETTPAAPSLFAMNPRSGVAKPVTDPEGNPILKAPDASAGTASVRKDALVAKLDKEMGNDLNPEMWTGPVKTQVEGVLRARHLVTLAQKLDSGDVNDLTEAEGAELASGVAALIKGGAPTVADIAHIANPKTLESGLAGIKSVITNSPVGTGQQKFTTRLLHSVERQRDVADGIIREEQAKRVANHRKLQEMDPDIWGRHVRNAGLDAKNFDPETGVYKAPAAASSAAKPKVIKVGGKTYREGPNGEAVEVK